VARSHAALLFRRELLDLRRERRVFRRLFLQPVVFVALLAAPAFFVQHAQARGRATTLVVAVSGDVHAVPGLREALTRKPFRLVANADPEDRLAAEAAAIGIQIPANAAELVAAGTPVPLRVLAFSTQDIANRAVPAITQRLAELRLVASRRMLVDAGAPAALAAPVRLEIADVATSSPEGIRFGIGQALPALLVIQLFGLVTIAQERLVGAKDRRTLEALLVLPVERTQLLLGIGGASMLIGAVSAIIVLLPLTLGLATAIASVSRSLAGPVDIALAIVLGAISIALTLTALGLYLGARAGSGSEGSVFVTLVQIAIFSTVVMSPFLAEVSARTLLAVPVVGPMLFVRDGVGAGSSLRNIGIMLGSQAAIAGVLVRRAARLLDQERSVLRASK
jgi:ABC-type Na+ efflux pump permease subunit